MPSLGVKTMASSSSGDRGHAVYTSTSWFVLSSYRKTVWRDRWSLSCTPYRHQLSPLELSKTRNGQTTQTLGVPSLAFAPSFSGGDVVWRGGSWLIQLYFVVYWTMRLPKMPREPHSRSLHGRAIRFCLDYKHESCHVIQSFVMSTAMSISSSNRGWWYMTFQQHSPLIWTKTLCRLA
jgi:hypothetical protein